MAADTIADTPTDEIVENVPMLLGGEGRCPAADAYEEVYNPSTGAVIAHTPLADAAFFTTAVRPQNQQRFRWDHAEDLIQPDRAEYFWARADGNGVGPSDFPTWGVDYDELRQVRYVPLLEGMGTD